MLPDLRSQMLIMCLVRVVRIIGCELGKSCFHKSGHACFVFVVYVACTLLCMSGLRRSGQNMHVMTYVQALDNSAYPHIQLY